MLCAIDLDGDLEDLEVAVEVPSASESLHPALAHRSRQPMTARQGRPPALGQGVHAAFSITDRLTYQPSATHPRALHQHLPKRRRPHPPLLYGGDHEQSRQVISRSRSCGRDDGRGESFAGRSPHRMDVQNTCLPHPHLNQAVIKIGCVRTVGDDRVQQRRVESLESLGLGCGQASERRPRAAVQNRDPESLSAGQRARVEYDDPRTDRLPAPGGNLATRGVPVEPDPAKLRATDDTVLVASQARQSSESLVVIGAAWWHDPGSRATVAAPAGSSTASSRLAACAPMRVRSETMRSLDRAPRLRSAATRSVRVPGGSLTTAQTFGRCGTRYQDDTVRPMAMTLRLTDDERLALQERAERDGISMQEAARRAVREYVARAAHRERVSEAAQRLMAAHRDALERLGR